MENVDVGVLRRLTTWRAAGQRAILVTVTRTWGSSPRPVGSIMALRDDGAVIGSVSGGCIEDDLIARFVHASNATAFSDAAPEWLTYGVTADEAHRFGLPCGGTLELLIERNPPAGPLAELVRLLDDGALVERLVRTTDGQATTCVTSPGATPGRTAEGFANVFGPEFRMFIVGAGSIAECLATMAEFCGFKVTVCDPREEYRQVWNGPAVQWATEMPDDALRAMQPDRRTCVVALSHDPKLDDLMLLEALESDCFYIGAIGSRRNSATRRQRLIEHFGQTDAALARLHGPIGMEIGSRMPPEIAVSIMAQVLAIKNGVAATGEAAKARADAPDSSGCPVSAS